MSVARMIVADVHLPKKPATMPPRLPMTPAMSHGEHGDLERDAEPLQRARKDVPAELVGAHQVGERDALQDRLRGFARPGGRA